MSYDFEELDSRVDIEEYSLDSSVPAFDCGKEGMNEFINTAEVRVFHRERLGKTRLVYLDGEFAAYFTLAPSALTRDDYTGDETEHVDDLYGKLPSIPARLLGRIAVDQDYQGEGLGAYLLDHTIALTRTNEKSHFRVILLHAHEDVIGFYEDHGFVLSQVERNSNRDNKIMFMDIGPIE